MAATETMAMESARPASSALWSFRLALFSVALVIFAIALHRLLGLPTPILLNTFFVAITGAGIAFLLSVAAIASIWISGRPGFGAALCGFLFSLGLLAWPAAVFSLARQLPPLNDVSTDVSSPPELVALARERGPGANDPAYPAARFAALQSTAYPDLHPVHIDRSAEEAFELVADAVRRLKFEIVAETPPGLEDEENPGLIEAVDRTLVIGFQDDVVIRVTGDQKSATVDIRSASRYGEHDFGRNASRVRDIIRELRARLESTVPAAVGSRTVRGKAKGGKAPVSRRLQGSDRGKAGRRSERDRAQPDAQRAPGPRERPH